MYASLKSQAGFSLIEVMVAMVLIVVISTSLMGYYRVLTQGFAAQWQYRQLWRIASSQADLLAPPLPPGWQASRMQTSGDGCVSITVTVTSPLGRQGQVMRRHCQINEVSQ